jgi:hypothetical protein
LLLGSVLLLVVACGPTRYASFCRVATGKALASAHRLGITVADLEFDQAGPVP